MEILHDSVSKFYSRIIEENWSAREQATPACNTGRRIIWNPIIDAFHRSSAYKISPIHPRRENIYTEVSASSRWRARYNRIGYRIFIFMHSRHSGIHRFRLHHPINLLPLPRPILNRDDAYPLRTFAHRPGILLLARHRRHERKCNFGQICRTYSRSLIAQSRTYNPLFVIAIPLPALVI